MALQNDFTIRINPEGESFRNIKASDWVKRVILDQLQLEVATEKVDVEDIDVAGLDKIIHNHMEGTIDMVLPVIKRFIHQ